VRLDWKGFHVANSKAPFSPAKRYGPKRDKPVRRVGQGGRYDSGGVPVRWADIRGNWVSDATSAVTDAGHGILFTRSREAGALGVTVYMGDTREQFWTHEPEAAEAYLFDLIQRAQSGQL